MPGYDGRGPNGIGPTGWGMGPCGRGMGFGRGRFFSRARGFFIPEMLPDEEKEVLENQKNWLISQLDAITKKIADLEK